MRFRASAPAVLKRFRDIEGYRLACDAPKTGKCRITAKLGSSSSASAFVMPALKLSEIMRVRKYAPMAADLPCVVVRSSKPSIQSSWTMAAVLFLVQQLSAADLAIRQQPSPESVAFGRYLASVERGDPFDQSGLFAVAIAASAPDLYKDLALLAIRQAGETGRSEFMLLGAEGDGAVAQEVIARYFAIEEQFSALPRTANTITPEHYKFQLRGQLKTGDGAAYVYDITPRKRRAGMFTGQIWIDAATGAQLLVSGRLLDFPSAGNTVSFVREMKLDASGAIRITHISFSVPLLGRSEVIVTEKPLPANYEIPRTEGALGN